VAVTPDGARALSASEDRTLKLWDLETGRELAMFTADEPLSCCAVAQHGALLVAAGAGRVHILQLLEPSHARLSEARS